MTPPLRFHRTVPVRALAELQAFDSGLLDHPDSRLSCDWIDFNFFGHVAHLTASDAEHKAHNVVRGKEVPAYRVEANLLPAKREDFCRWAADSIRGTFR